MPIDYKQYPSNWKTEIRPAILERAKNCCEICGVENYAVGLRAKEGNFIIWKEIEDALEDRGYDYFDYELKHHVSKNGEVKKLTKIILTIAHLDHDKTNHNVNYDRLKALCQRCHLSYDMDRHIANRKNNKHKQQVKLDLTA